MILVRDAKERERFLKFAVVGTIGFVVDSLTFILMRFGVGFIGEVSNVISFCAGVVSNFLFNRYWIYPDSRSKPIMSQVTQFAAVNIVGLVIRTVVFSLIKGPMVKLFGTLLPDFIFTPTEMGEIASLAIVVIIVMFWNFFVNRFWTYNDVK